MVQHKPPVSKKARQHLELNEQDKDGLLDALDRDRLAASSWPVRASLINTWYRHHRTWHGTEVPVLPITSHKVRCVAAVMKNIGYRSFQN